MKRKSICKITAIVLTVLLVFSLADMIRLYSYAEENTQTETQNGEENGQSGEQNGENGGSGEQSGQGDENGQSGENSESGTTEETQEEENSVVRRDRTNEQNIYYFLIEQMNLNEAAACGVLANIKKESGFSPLAQGDKIGDTYTSFGICQWHNNRWNSLKIFCTTMEYEWVSLEGQLWYLKYELEHNYRHVLSSLKQVSNTPEGAYDAGYVFCAKFEIPANTAMKSDQRGLLARDTYWPKYGGFINDSGTLYIWKTENDKSYWYEGGVRQGTSSDAKGVMGDGTVRGREIYDPMSDGWYWLDAAYDGAKAVNKEVWIPYVFQGEENWDSDTIISKSAGSGSLAGVVEKAVRAHGTLNAGKWVRYDSQGKMIKGWYTVSGADVEIYPSQAGNTYYYDPITGIMAKGSVNIGGTQYYFNEVTGALQR